MRNLVLILLSVSMLASSNQWFVRSSGGNDANTGQSFAQGLATTQAGLDSVRAGDTLWLCGGPFTLTATDTVDMDGGGNASATTTTPIHIFGADGSGNSRDNASRTEITTASTLARGLWEILPAADFINCRDLEFDAGGVGNGEYAIYVSAEGAIAWTWDNCTFHDADNHVIYLTVHLSFGEQRWLFDRCEVYNGGLGGTGGGIEALSSSRGKFCLNRCSVHDNAGDGVTIGGSICLWVKNSLIYDNGDDGLYCPYDAGDGMLIEGNVFFGNGGDGVDIDINMNQLKFVNNIMRSNTGYGMNTNSGSFYTYRNVHHNCASNNTAGAIDINGGTLIGLGNVTSDPLFTSETDGSEDFSLQSGSPCKNTGWDNVAF